MYNRLQIRQLEYYMTIEYRQVGEKFADVI